MILQASQKVGLSLPIDGSVDSEWDIKGFPGIEICKWNHDLGLKNQFADVDSKPDDNEVIEFIAYRE